MRSVVAIILLTILGATDVTSADHRRDTIRASQETTAAPPVAVVDGSPRVLQTPSRTGDVASGGREQPAPEPLSRRVLKSLGTVIGDQGMAAQFGGDDVAIAIGADANYPFIQITSSGNIFVAINRVSAIDVYRSTDSGDTWTLWSTFDDAGGPSLFMCDFDIAEGTANRAFISYGINAAGFKVRVAYASATAAVPSWTIVDAFNVAGVTFPIGIIGIDLDTDQEDFDSYFVYIVATGNDVNGTDVWFNVSANQGTSFGTPYRIVNNTAGSSVVHGTPKVRFGFGDWIHVTYEKYSSPPPRETGLYYLRAPNFASGGAPTWEAPQTLNAIGPSDVAENMGLEASLVDGTVIAVDGTRVRFSTGSGSTWPPANSQFLPFVGSNDVESPVHISDSGDVTILAGNVGSCGTGLCIDAMYLFRSTTADLHTWTPPYESALSLLPDIPTEVNHRPGFASDPSRGGRFAAVWWSYDFDNEANNMVRFDAEWRRDPGYANTEPGFPIDVSGGGQTPPAVAQIDFDVAEEIIFATRSGDVHVVEPNGVERTGWPVNIGLIPYDAPVAAGDLLGNGDPTIVAGNHAGVVYAFDRDGEILPGWPVDVGTGSAVYVSIGALGPPNLRYVVALSGAQVFILNYLGENVAPPWTNIPFGTYSRPAAIGDVDADGITEIVSLAGPNVYYHRKDEVIFEGNQVPGEIFSDAPTLADINLDGDLEVAAPTESGKMYIFDPGDPGIPGWPITVSPGTALTSAAWAHILGTSQPELVFAERDGDVHIRIYTGVEQTGFPKDVTAAGPVYMPPMLTQVSAVTSNVNIGVIESVGYSYRNISGIVTPGWPRNLPGSVEETFAAGDIDNDGRNEIVVLGVNYLTVLDVGIAPSSDPTGQWPMYGHDAQRTGCLGCIETTTDVDDAISTARRLTLSVSPNPFNPSTLIEYEMAAEGPAKLEVYDVTGRLVETLVDKHHSAGRHSLRYTPSSSSGVYFLRLFSGAESTSRKLVLLK